MSPNRILICGPPGAGKSTAAYATGLPVFDVDAAPWHGDERAFGRALRELAGSTSDAVVIRAGATRSARAAAVELIGATREVILTTAPEVCRARVRARKRPRPPLARQIAAIGQWWADYEPEARAARADWLA